MNLEYFLTMADIAVVRESASADGMGGRSIVTTSTTIARGVIYQAGSNALSFMSDKMYADSSHILVCEPSAYTFTIADKRVTQGGRTFTVQGSDNVMGKSEISVVGLRLQE
jgi:hypothetical protein